MTETTPTNNGLKIKFGSFCIYLTRKMALTILAIAAAGGGGGWAAMGLATSDELGAVAETSRKHVTKDKGRHTIVNKRLDGHDKQLKVITVKIGSIQEVQHWQVADQSADRICQRVPIRRRQNCYKRLFKWSLDRLRQKKLPCTNLECSN